MNLQKLGKVLCNVYKISVTEFWLLVISKVSSKQNFLMMHSLLEITLTL